MHSVFGLYKCPKWQSCPCWGLPLFFKTKLPTLFKSDKKLVDGVSGNNPIEPVNIKFAGKSKGSYWFDVDESQVREKLKEIGGERLHIAASDFGEEGMRVTETLPMRGEMRSYWRGRAFKHVAGYKDEPLPKLRRL